ncbi:MAG TPA: response regulator [Candidatus Polarisedimenticolaceae bacterium]|nr:response regulator [Candidatus Polarisedimenticolaceae bacterium]
MRVLVIDDEAFLAELVRLALEADGHECYTAVTFEAADEILRSGSVDLLTLDLVMGGRNPLDWLEETILRYPGLSGRVFIQTARLLDHEESLRVRGCGARVIHKPFTLHQLRESVSLMSPVTPPTSKPEPESGRGGPELPS